MEKNYNMLPLNTSLMTKQTNKNIPNVKVIVFWERELMPSFHTRNTVPLPGGQGGVGHIESRWLNQK